MGHGKAVLNLYKDIADILDLLHLSHEAIICVGMAQDIVVFNDGAEEIFGYKVNEIIGRPLDALIPERYQKQHSQQLSEFMRGNNRSKLMAQRGPVTGRRKDGKEFIAHASISKFSYGGEITMAVVLHEIDSHEPRA